MSIVQTVLVFVGIPGVIIGLIAFAVYGKPMLHQPNRYRPGRPWPYEAAWFVPHPDAVLHAEGSPHPQVEARSSTSTTAIGGASGEW